MPAVSPSKYRVEATVDDVPHISAKAKKEMWDATPPHMREARFKGIPSRGIGAVYPYSVESITVDPFPLPPHWRRGYALDDGWKVTAAGFFAYDADHDILYLTSELYLKQHTPQQTAQKIAGRGKWMPGVGDAAAKTRDGVQVIELYRAEGLNLALADKEVEAGLYDVSMRLASGRLKIFSTCTNTLWEYQRYRRDENGKIIKQNDHCMDAMRYACRQSAIKAMIVKPVETILSSDFAGGDPHIGY